MHTPRIVILPESHYFNDIIIPQIHNFTIRKPKKKDNYEKN